jgi:ankyrin repeat protein
MNTYRQTPLQYTSGYNYTEITALLIEKGAKEDIGVGYKRIPAYGIGVYELGALLFLFAFVLFAFVFIDILRSDFEGNNKIVWLLAVIFVPFIGAIAYFIIGRNKKSANAPEKIF